MRVLITWGSKLGGTAGIARTLGGALREEGLDVDLLPAAEAGKEKGFDAVIVGGALYANRWHEDARRFVLRREDDLRRVPVWFFSSGPLDESADRDDIAPTRLVKALMESVGAQGHHTFGGRIAPDAKGFPASAMARSNPGDWRNIAQIRAWGRDIAQALPHARPGVAVPLPGRSPIRLIAHAAVGWALCAALMAGLLRVTTPGAALALHAVAAPLLFILIARRYFQPTGAHEPLRTAVAFTAVVALLDLLVVAGLLERSLAMFTSVAASWLPLALIFLVTWVTGGIMSTLPWPSLPKREERGGPHGPLRPQRSG